MSNGNIILAFARDTVTSAMSSTGNTFVAKSLATTQVWKDAAGEAGKFCYITNDSRSGQSMKAFATDDIGSNWHANLMPMPQQAAIIAIADGASSLYYSYDGTTFKV